MSDISALIVDDSSVMRPCRYDSSQGGEEQVWEAIAAGAYGYMRRRFTAEEVKERVLPLLETQALRSRNIGGRQCRRMTLWQRRSLWL